MADDTRTDDVKTVVTEDETEPATTHDVAEGGAMGAIGGAIVGALAGGPLGALIGAVVGGVASAGAVELVDQHDHDNPSAAVDHAVIPIAPMDSPYEDISTIPIVPADTEPVSPVLAVVEPVTEIDTPELVSTSEPIDAPEPAAIPEAVATPEPIGTFAPVVSDPHQLIRERAYEIYELRGRGDGQDVQDWLEAEREVLNA